MNSPGALYAHERADWPSYTWEHRAFSEKLAQVNFRRGALIVAMGVIGFELQQQTMLSVLVEDVRKSSEIEGERFSEAQVRSSIARRLGMDIAGLPKADRDVEGVVEMMLDATQRFDAPLDAERIHGWHAALFPTGRSGLHRITIGTWRNDSQGPMQVVSGPIGREQVHSQAPSADRLEGEMSRFLDWFENERLDPVLKAALAHLWFVTIHPLDDGNGRIGRAIMDMALARGEGTSQRFYSMSAQILKEKDSYYDVLEATQKGTMDVTPWIQWFLARLESALGAAEGVLRIVRTRQAFWNTHRDADLNERQIKIINMLFEGFVGKLRREKYARITKVADRTAARDLADLVVKGILRVEEGSAGRSTSYELTPEAMQTSATS